MSAQKSSNTKNWIAAGVVATALAAGPLMAQLPTQEQPARSVPGARPGAGGVPGTTLPAGQAAQNMQGAQGGQADTRYPVSVADRYFLEFASHGNLAEIQTGQLALQKSKNPAVRRMAEMLVKEHSLAQQQVRELGRLNNVPIPEAPNGIQQAAFQQLSKLSGAEFDRMFIAMQVREHVGTVNQFYNEGMVGNNLETKQWAKATLPKIAGHTEELRRVARQVGAPAEFGRPEARELARQSYPLPVALRNLGTGTAASAAMPAAGGGMNHGGGSAGQPSSPSTPANPPVNP